MNQEPSAENKLRFGCRLQLLICLLLLPVSGALIASDAPIWWTNAFGMVLVIAAILGLVAAIRTLRQIPPNREQE